ncbi:MAG: thioesterase family protein [Synechococcaceae cyanobacterium]|nr:thioesterase family protein [Synechococcaceae cyanobacterium]
MRPSDWLQLRRTVRFGDTDAAGVMHFHQLLRWCHEAYEESLERFGISAEAVFPSLAQAPTVALPIVHCQADFLAPLVCGDPLEISLQPQREGPGCFSLHYRFSSHGLAAAAALTRHRSIDAASRDRRELPEPIRRWLEASQLGQIEPLV